MTAERLLVVGAGLAAVEVVTGLRDGGWTGRITVVGEEAEPPYQRPPLSKAGLAGVLAVEEVRLRSAEFYADRDVSLVLGDRVLDLGLRADGTGRARCRSGRTVDHDRVVLATGAAPRRLPALAGEGVHVLRTLQDAQALRAQLRPGRRLVVVGAGFVGLEVAAAARDAGCSVTVVEVGDQVLGRVVTAAVAAHVAGWHQAQGTTVHTGVAVTGIARDDGAVAGVLLDDGSSVAADLVVVGVGAEPRVELARAAGLRCEGGVVVGTDALASDGHTLAVGDCAIGPDPAAPPGAGRLLRLESVDHATRGAAAAVATLLGVSQPPPAAPWFWSDQGRLKVQVVGVPSGSDEVVVRRWPDDTDRLVCAHLRDGAVVAAEAVGSPADFVALRKAVAAGLALDRDLLADPAVRLGQLVAAARVAVA